MEQRQTIIVGEKYLLNAVSEMLEDKGFEKGTPFINIGSGGNNDLRIVVFDYQYIFSNKPKYQNEYFKYALESWENIKNLRPVYRWYFVGKDNGYYILKSHYNGALIHLPANIVSLEMAEQVVKTLNLYNKVESLAGGGGK